MFFYTVTFGTWACICMLPDQRWPTALNGGGGLTEYFGLLQQPGEDWIAAEILEMLCGFDTLKTK